MRLGVQKKEEDEEYAWVRMEHVEVSMSDNFELFLELRLKLENIGENEIKRYEMNMT